jgi:hypothetical protein
METSGGVFSRELIETNATVSCGKSSRAEFHALHGPEAKVYCTLVRAIRIQPQFSPIRQGDDASAPCAHGESRSKSSLDQCSVGDIFNAVPPPNVIKNIGQAIP